jgi:hypothetical protein
MVGYWEKVVQFQISKPRGQLEVKIQQHYMGKTHGDKGKL